MKCLLRSTTLISFENLQMPSHTRLLSGLSLCSEVVNLFVSSAEIHFKVFREQKSPL